MNDFIRASRPFLMISVCCTLSINLSVNAAQQETHLPTDAAQKTLEAQEEMIRRQGEQIKALQKRLDALDGKRHPRPSEQRSSANRPPDKKEAVIKPVGQAPDTREEDYALLAELGDSGRGVLVGDGNFVVETSFSYAYTDNNRVFLDGYSFIPALVVGVIDLREIKRHSFIGSLSGRYGISDRWEFDVKVPYVARNDSQRSRPVSVGVGEDEIFTASGEGLGDIEIATRYQINRSSGGTIFVANLNATIPTGESPFDVEFVQSTPGAVFPVELPTGSGYYSIQPSLTAIYPTDPGVFYGNISYAYNREFDDDESGNVDPGDSAGISFGLGLSLNERTSMSLSYSHKHVLESKINNEDIKGSELDIGQLIIGYSFRYSEQTNLNLSLSIGVTDDAQNVRLNFRLPMRI